MQPLAERLRPQNLDEFVNQEHLTGKNGLIRKMLENETVVSMILWGPPGTGKTTLASIIAKTVQRPFFVLSAVNSGVKDVRNIIEKAKKTTLFNNKTPILFIDEIHRFSKSQQDALLEAVEKGTIILIGATTENPSFEVITPLLSRCQVYVLKPLQKKDLEILLRRAIENDKYLKEKQITLQQTDALIAYSGGDARKLLNIFELIINANEKKHIIINNDNVKDFLQHSALNYDKLGDTHYDTASAFIKSVRGSDPDAALYWLARMLEAGEDIKFIARRLIISAAEDIGPANPNALLLAVETFRAVEIVGMPEARIILANTTIYLASSPKSNSAYKAINKAIDIVKKTGNLSVPLHLRNAPTNLMKDLGYGQDYKYPHDFENHYIPQQYMPDELKDFKIYEPAKNPSEEKIKQRLEKLWGKTKK